MSQLDLLTGSMAALPDEAELQRRFDWFNETLFKSRLPAASIRWSTRMRIAGTCQRHRLLITLSRPYHERFPQDVDDTLKHEMIHLRYAGHGPAFRREAQRVGASVHCREYDGIHPKARLVYACPSCWREYRRMKPAELYCGRCSRGRLVPQFRLVLKREIEPERARRARPTSGTQRRHPRTESVSRRRQATAAAALGLFGSIDEP